MNTKITIITTAKTFDISIPNEEVRKITDLFNLCLEKQNSAVFLTVGPSELPHIGIAASQFVAYIVDGNGCSQL